MNKPLRETDLTFEDLVVIKDYLKLRLQDSDVFNSVNGFWFVSDTSWIHFVLENVKSATRRKELLEKGCKIFINKYPDLAKFLDIAYIMDDFNADFVFDFAAGVDLTDLYGLAKITCGGQ